MYAVHDAVYARYVIARTVGCVLVSLFTGFQAMMPFFLFSFVFVEGKENISGQTFESRKDWCIV